MLDAVGIQQAHTSRSFHATGALRLTDTTEQDRDALRAWLRQNLAQSGVTPTKAAKEIGVATTTLTKFLNDPDYAFTPSTPVVSKLERFFGRAAPRSSGGVLRPMIEAMQIDPQELPAPQKAALLALAAGRKSIEAWTMSGTALQAAGVLPGDVLLVDLNEPARAGDIVCAELFESGLRRIVFRIFEKPYLVAPSLEPRSWMPLVVDDRNVIVRGVVTDRIAARRIS